jgi:Mrp family chromosome partitioning ATPase
MVLASRLDGVVLIVRGGHTSRRSLKDSLGLLNNARAEILGIVMNGINFRRERYHYYYSKYYSAPHYHEKTESGTVKHDASGREEGFTSL